MCAFLSLLLRAKQQNTEAEERERASQQQQRSWLIIQGWTFSSAEHDASVMITAFASAGRLLRERRGVGEVLFSVSALDDAGRGLCTERKAWSARTVLREIK